MSEPITLACNPSALPSAIRDEHLSEFRRLLAQAVDVRELPKGWAFQLPNDTHTFLHVAHLVERERRCCPFFEFTLRLQPHDGQFWLELGGGEQVKRFLKAEMAVEAGER